MILAALLTICPPVGIRSDCVHDGDTGFFGRTKWRLENVDTPELNGKCQYERDLAIKARDRLLVLLNSGKVTYTTHGYDRMQKPRLLVRISVEGRDIGQRLIAEGLARPYEGRRRPWCPTNPPR